MVLEQMDVDLLEKDDDDNTLVEGLVGQMVDNQPAMMTACLNTNTAVDEM